MKFFRIFPEMCARTLCLFSSSTRNIAFGSGSITVAITSIASSLLIDSKAETENLSSLWRPSVAVVAAAPVRDPLAAPGQAPERRQKLSVEPREDVRAIPGDGHHVLEVRGITAVQGDGGPVVAQNAELMTAGSDHRLNGEHHALFQDGAVPGLPVIRNLRFFVEFATDSVTYELTHNIETVLLHILLHRRRNVSQVVLQLYSLDGKRQRLLGNTQQLPKRLRYLSHRRGQG